MSQRVCVQHALDGAGAVYTHINIREQLQMLGDGGVTAVRGRAPALRIDEMCARASEGALLWPRDTLKHAEESPRGSFST